MTSVVTICSNGLLHLGQSPISSLTEEVDSARLAANLWPSVRDRLLRSHPWNCATKRTTLAPETAAPAFDFTYKFALPGDLLRVVSVGLYGQEDAYRVEGRFILANTNVLRLTYVYRNEDVATWDAALIHAAELSMAAAMAYPITKSSSQQQLMEAKASEAMREARVADGQENPAEEWGDYPLIRARFGGRNY